MNFKIENNFLNITNYPSIERHFEGMARKGWLINKIILGSIFIYKKIEKGELDFSITPYEIETAFTRKSKEELEEFNSVCKSVGWNYATKSGNLHIYFKAKGSQAIDIQTDEEEEFKTLGIMGKKQILSYCILILLFFLLPRGVISNNVYSMKNGFVQILALYYPIGTILAIWGIINMKEFLKKNRKNMEIGKTIEYSDSNFHIPKIILPITFIFLLGLVLYIIYTSLVLKNQDLLIALPFIIIGNIIGTIYIYFIKPSKKSLTYKKVGFILIFIVNILVQSSWSTNFDVGNIVGKKDSPNIENYKVLSIDDFSENSLKDEGDLSGQISFLIPKSYEYYSCNEEDESITTEYGKALTEKLAVDLVDKYKRESEDSRKIIQEGSIVEDSEKLWNVDEVYFLNYEKTEMILRSGKEVFFLEGKDFSNPEIIRIVKDKLELN